jgi:hypothetical protein
MTSRINYMPDEWKVLSDAPLAVGGAVAAAAPGGIVGAVKEGVALINCMMKAAQRHPNNQLIQELAPKGMSREQIDMWTQVARTMMQQSQTAPLMDAGVVACQKVAMVLQSKAEPQEADEFKRWLLEVGEDVANAAREGGSVGTNVTPQEAQILNMMSSALGVMYIPSPPESQSYMQP